MKVRIVISTVSAAADGEKILSELLEERLIACGNLFPKGVSLYRWKGKVEREEEHVLLMKTSEEQTARLKHRFQELHPYDVPEFVVLNPSDISDNYLSWVLENVGDAS